MKNLTLITLLFLMTMAYSLPVMAKNATTFDGRMQGYNCVIHGHACPLDSLDPHLALEPDFVLYLEKGDYFLLPNVARIVKAKYVHQPIRVIGDLNPKYNSIDVDELQIKNGDAYKTVWSKKRMLDEIKKTQEEWYGAGGG